MVGSTHKYFSHKMFLIKYMDKVKKDAAPGQDGVSVEMMLADCLYKMGGF